MSKTFRNSCLLVLTALIWGIAFVAQSEGGDAIGPYSFNCVRTYLGCIVLLPVIKMMDSIGLSRKPKTDLDRKNLWVGGIACGVVMFIASNVQQLGLYYGTPSSKAGFLTACYIILVPILSIFLKKKCHWNVWVGVCLTVAGLYLLCMTGELTFQVSDLLLMLCALMFAVHILVVDYFSPKVDGVRLSCIQFLVCAILTTFPMVFCEMDSNWLSQFNVNAWIPILYAGICSCGVAYTLQIIGQQDVNPTIASLLMSLESVFCVLASWALLGQVLSVREVMGCALIFVAIILAQLPIQNK